MCYVKLTVKFQEFQLIKRILILQKKKKNNTLRYKFRRELKKQNNSKKCGAGSDETYEPIV